MEFFDFSPSWSTSRPCTYMNNSAIVNFSVFASIGVAYMHSDNATLDKQKPGSCISKPSRWPWWRSCNIWEDHPILPQSFSYGRPLQKAWSSSNKWCFRNKFLRQAPVWLCPHVQNRCQRSWMTTSRNTPTNWSLPSLIWEHSYIGTANGMTLSCMPRLLQCLKTWRLLIGYTTHQAKLTYVQLVWLGFKLGFMGHITADDSDDVVNGFIKQPT